MTIKKNLLEQAVADIEEKLFGKSDPISMTKKLHRSLNNMKSTAQQNKINNKIRFEEEETRQSNIIAKIETIEYVLKYGGFVNISQHSRLYGEIVSGFTTFEDIAHMIDSFKVYTYEPNVELGSVVYLVTKNGMLEKFAANIDSSD